jgi:hypothetical protein
MKLPDLVTLPPALTLLIVFYCFLLAVSVVSKGRI